MKCDKLKPLVFSINDLAYVDEIMVKKNFDNPHDHAVYKATEVDAAIDELKTEHHKERDEYISMVHSREQTIKELKQKLESVRASMYADVVDAGMENRRLRRALWIARALRAESRKNYWYARSCHEGDDFIVSIDGSPVKYIGCIKRTNFDWLKTWSEVECKCLKKAEEYK